MKPLLTVISALTCFSAPAADNAPPTPPKFSHPRIITNAWLPLGSLAQDVLQNEAERVERTVRPEQHRSFKIGDQTVDALAVEDREYEDGELKEVTLDYFAQADDGAVSPLEFAAGCLTLFHARAGC